MSRKGEACQHTELRNGGKEAEETREEEGLHPENGESFKKAMKKRSIKNLVSVYSERSDRLECRVCGLTVEEFTRVCDSYSSEVLRDLTFQPCSLSSVHFSDCSKGLKA